MITLSAEQLRDIIAAAIEKVLGARSATDSSQAGLTSYPKRALVLFTGAMLGLDDAVASLKRLRAAGVELSYIQSEAAKHLITRDVIESIGMSEPGESITGGKDLLIVPTLTVSFAAKVAHGIADDLATNTIATFIQSDRPVVMSRTAACPDSPEKRSIFPNMPEAYRKVLRANLTACQSFGIRLTDSKNLDRAVLDVLNDVVNSDGCGCPSPDNNHTFGTCLITSDATGNSGASCATPHSQTGQVVTFDGRVLTAHQVHTYRSGTVVTLAPKALLTALAAEEAARCGVTIERSK